MYSSACPVDLMSSPFHFSEAVKPVQLQQCRDQSKRDSDSLFLDAEVSDALFHFDTIVSELEQSTLTPRSLTPSNPEMRTPTPSQVRELLTPDILVPNTSSDSPVVEGGDVKRRASEPALRIVQQKFRVRNIQQQFLQNAQRDTASQLNIRSPEVPASRSNVQTIIAQMKAFSRESSPSPAPESEEKEPPSRQSRHRASSISQRISMLTQVSTEGEVLERKEQPVLPSRKISEITHDFENKKVSPESESQPRGAPFRKKRRSSSARKNDAPKILSPPKSSQMNGHKTPQENGLPPVEKSSDAPPVTAETSKYTSLEIEEALLQVEASLESEQSPLERESEDTTQQLEEAGEDGTSPLTSPALTSPTLLIEPAEVPEPASISQSMSHSSLANPTGGVVECRTESTSSSDVLLSPPVEQSYRFRSISDVSHNTRILTSYRTEGSITASSTCEHENDPTVSSNPLPVLTILEFLLQSKVVYILSSRCTPDRLKMYIVHVQCMYLLYL